MARNNVGTPRFFINIPQYLKSKGTESSKVFNLNPMERNDYLSNSTAPVDSMLNEKSYVAFLGHIGGYLSINNSNFDFDYSIDVNADQTVDDDGEVNSGSISPEYAGFSIVSFDGTGINNINVATQFGIGCVSIGNYYEMPHAPDMSLKLSYEYDGVKQTQGIGGSTLTNSIYKGTPDWWMGGAWQLETAIGAEVPIISNARTGRRIWDISFSFLTDEQIMPNLGTQNYEPDVITEDILTGSDFFSAVWNRCIGLPFIFQPDRDNNSVDQFAIARFDANSLQYTQVGHNIYNVAFKIRESW